MDAVILAGGKGTRMDNAAPKPLVMAGKKQIIQHQIDYLKDKVDRIIVSIGHRGDEIESAVKGMYHMFDEIYFSREEEPLGTAGALKKALNMAVRYEVIALNCDDITNIQVSDLERMTENTLCVAKPRLQSGNSTNPFGAVVIDKDGYVISFNEKGALDGDFVSCGWYKFHVTRKFYDMLPGNGMLEKDVFPKMANNRELKAYINNGFWKPLTSKENVSEFNKLQLPEELR